MLKKIDRGQQFLLEYASAFQCPFCHTGFQLTDYSFVCQKGHRFDLSKKGTIYFLKHVIQTEYTKEMFEPRGRMIASGMYRPVIDTIASWVAETGLLVDVGCGEGGFLNQLYQQGVERPSIGFDLSKDGVYLATNQSVPAFWCTADLTNLPFKTGSITTILNIFSPSHYQEFQRILTPAGQVIKVVPQSGYLQELRAAFYPDNPDKQKYSNQAVIDKFTQELEVVNQQRISYEFVVPKDRRLDLLEMSPLEWGATSERKAILRETPLEKITIDVDVLHGKKR